MTFTVTPQPDNIPPRVRIDVNTDDSSKPFTSLTIKRDGKTLREQPFVGSSSAVLFDYEAPFGTPAGYLASGAVGAYSSVLDAGWVNLTGWTIVNGSPTVSGGALYSGIVRRSATFATSAGRLLISNPFTRVNGRIQIGSWLTVATGTAGAVSVTFGGVSRTVTQAAAGYLDIAWDGSRVSVRSSSSSVQFEGASATPGTFVVEVSASLGGASSFIASDRSSSSPFTATATTTLNMSETWLIHPSKPALSVPIYSHDTRDGLRYIEASSGESKSSQAVSTVHRPVGRRRAVVIASGPRQADEWTLVVESETIAAKNSLRAIVDDQTPLLLRSPASAGMDLPDDWYSVGDVTVTRVEVPVITQVTTTTMPLTPVDEPIVRVGALWTWGDVLTTYSTWQQVLDANDTWLDVLAGPQP